MILIEFQNFNLDAKSLSFIGTIIFTTLQGWSLMKQNKLIWKEKSGGAISVIWFIYYAFLFFSVMIYGLSIKSIAIFYNGLLFLLYIPILLGLKKFKGFFIKEKIVFCILIIVSFLVIFSNFKDKIVFALLVGGVISLATQPIEMLMRKSVKIIDIRLNLIYFLSTCFWFGYAYLFNNWVYKIITPLNLIFHAITIFLWLYYNNKYENRRNIPIN